MLTAFLLALLAPAAAPPALPPIRMPVKAAPVSAIEAVMLAPLFDRPFACVEHPDGQMPFTGDALGTDCMVVGGMEDGGFSRFYRTDGRANADWYGWGAVVHAPVSGVVVGLFDKGDVNVPGTMGRPPASMLQIEAPDGLLVTLGHVTKIGVARGQKVMAGDPVAVVGNNGMARAPHIHIGASRGSTPAQIRWDLKAMARLQKN